MADSVAEPEENTLREYLESLAVILNPHEFKALQMMAEGYNPDEMAKALNIKLHSAIQLRYRIITKLRQKYGKLKGN